ncbi:MAG: hypothetical protein IJQ93_07755 [Bacteroidales bacterium]|nr:hypothetical protein [Bacteroidales bacterium]
MLSKIWFPAAVVSLAIAGTVAGIDPVEPSYSVEVAPLQDTVKYPVAGYKLRRRGDFSSEALPDSVLRKLGITLTFESDDSIPKLTARDTIHAPDSLREIDPFRYKYYVALLDSLTHRIVSDSLRESYRTFMEQADTVQARLDSADRFKLDSLYARDSVVRAREAFLAWYNSLSKEERKKYDIEQKVKRKMAVSDSLKAIKEEKLAVRDSIRENTPRVLETFALPDSLHFKRIITWNVDSDFHDVHARVPDTTYNHYFYDYAFRREDVNSTWLGVAGSAVQPYNWFRRRTAGEEPEFYSYYAPWSTSAKDFRMYNTKTPYTELAYWGTLLADDAKESDNLHIFTTQNILPEWNFSILYERWGGGGMLNNEKTTNKTFAVGTNYLGKRYMMHAGYISNTVKRDENGGITDLADVRDTTIDAREMRIALSKASSSIRKRSVFLDQQYRIPFTFINKWKARKDTTILVDTLSTENITTAFIGHSSEYTSYGRKYTDAIATSDAAGRAFYDNVFNYNPTASNDTLGLHELDNKVFIRLQPWAADAAVSKLDIGIGDRLQTWFDSTATSHHVRENSLYAYAGANGRMLRGMSWDARGHFNFAGAHAGDFDVTANAAYEFYPFRRARKSPVSFGASFSSMLRDPDFYQRRMYSNHYIWNNSFDKISTTRISGRVDVPYWKLSAEASYGLLANNIYYDTLGVVRQNATAMSVLAASLRKEFVLGNLVHLDNRLLFQVSSNEEVLPLPLLALNGKYYIQFIVQRNDRGEKVLEMQAGANVLWNTEWYAPAWNPALGVFHNQNVTKYQNGPIIDLFVNAQWKRACIFIKWENAGMGWPLDRADYFTAHNYINTQRILKLGLYWPFYTQPGRGGSSSSSMGEMPGGLR